MRREKIAGGERTYAVCVSFQIRRPQAQYCGCGKQSFRLLKGGIRLDFIKFLEYVRLYNIDVVVIGAGVFVLTEVLKRTVLKKLSSKLITFVPFLLGVAAYLIYGGFAIGNFAENAALFAQKGFSCGSLATVIYVVCKQFILSGVIPSASQTRTELVKELIAPYAEISDEQAEKIAETAKTDENLAKEMIAELGEGAAVIAETVLKAIRDV